MFCHNKYYLIFLFSLLISSSLSYTISVLLSQSHTTHDRNRTHAEHRSQKKRQNACSVAGKCSRYRQARGGGRASAGEGKRQTQTSTAAPASTRGGQAHTAADGQAQTSVAGAASATWHRDAIGSSEGRTASAAWAEARPMRRHGQVRQACVAGGRAIAAAGKLLQRRGLCGCSPRRTAWSAARAHRCRGGVGSAGSRGGAGRVGEQGRRGRARQLGRRGRAGPTRTGAVERLCRRARASRADAYSGG